jgi:hypothetical protein
VILILLGLRIIIEEDFNLVVHLRAYIFEEEASEDSESTESKRGECHFPIIHVKIASTHCVMWNLLNTFQIALYERCASGLGDSCCQSLYLLQPNSAEWEGRKNSTSRCRRGTCLANLDSTQDGREQRDSSGISGIPCDAGKSTSNTELRLVGAKLDVSD